MVDGLGYYAITCCFIWITCVCSVEDLHLHIVLIANEIEKRLISFKVYMILSKYVNWDAIIDEKGKHMTWFASNKI